MNRQAVNRITFDIAIFLGATGVTIMAQMTDRPRSAVLVLLTGVMVIAVRSGLGSALLSAVGASLVYNFYLNEPSFRFSIGSADELVPLFAFNILAFLAAVMVGRLKDSARKAYEAQSETAFMLTVSDRLQSAVKVEEIETAVRGVIPRQGVASVEIFLTRGKAYWRPSTGTVEFDTLKPLIGEDADQVMLQGKAVVVALEGARGQLGFVKFRLSEPLPDRQSSSKLQSISAMLALAVERCLLLEEVAEARAQVRSEALKDALLSSVSHDLRTPVTVIQAAAGALASSQITLPREEHTRLLATILEQCARLDRYTAEILDVGQIQAGIAPDRLEKVNLTEIVGLAIKHARAARPNIAIERSLAPGPHYAQANAAMLEQAIVNLIDNAQKFGGEAGPVTVSLDNAGRQARIAIVDRGPGIHGEEREQVFARFFKGKRSGSKAGMGLGLFIARGFIEAFGGTIAVESPLDGERGTRVLVTLPLVEADAADMAA